MWSRTTIIPTLLALGLAGCAGEDPAEDETGSNDDIPLYGEDLPEEEEGEEGEGPGGDTLLGTWVLLTVNGVPLEHDGESDGICTWTYGYTLDLVFTGQEGDIFGGEMVRAEYVEVTGEDCDDAGTSEGRVDTFGLEGSRLPAGGYLVEARDLSFTMDCEMDEPADQLVCLDREGNEVIWQR